MELLFLNALIHFIQCTFYLQRHRAGHCWVIHRGDKIGSLEVVGPIVLSITSQLVNSFGPGNSLPNKIMQICLRGKEQSWLEWTRLSGLLSHMSLCLKLLHLWAEPWGSLENSLKTTNVGVPSGELSGLEP